MITEYNGIWIVLALLLSVFDRVYYDTADNLAWICNTLHILNKTYSDDVYGIFVKII